MARAAGRVRLPLRPGERDALQLSIAIVDRLVPTGPNCYRRCLLELAFDPEAARAPVYFGLKAGGGKKSGHAWLPRHDAQGTLRSDYDAVFEL